MFLRTAEFLWQEGHTAHATHEEALEHTFRMLEVYRSFSQDALAVPVVAGEKPAHERFPGAESTFSIEAMMQDGKALQAGTAHYLGTNFSHAQNIRYQTERGDLAYAHTTSWGATTRLVGAVAMTHGDDDGLRLPPVIAPRQILLVPILRDRPEDGAVVQYCDELAAEINQGTAFGEPIRAAVDRKAGRAVDKRWSAIKRGVPIVCEVGARDMTARAVTMIRRDRARNGERIASTTLDRDELVRTAGALLAAIQAALHAEARTRLFANISSQFATFADLEAHFKDSTDTDGFRGWAQVAWAKPEGAALDAIDAQLKALKLTIRNAPLHQESVAGKRCIFSGAPAKESVLIGRAY
jgi:prolyl-tRNA synthetase